MIIQLKLTITAMIIVAFMKAFDDYVEDHASQEVYLFWAGTGLSITLIGVASLISAIWIS